MKVAVVGAGIAGLSAAWLVSSRHETLLLEAEDRLGGHANTVEADGVPVDTGFIVYNTACYPNLVALFAHLGVPIAPTHMGFSVSLGDGRYEYSGDGAATFFGQRRNLMSPAHWRMASDILRFFRQAPALLSSAAPEESLGDWLSRNRYSRYFVERHIVPMGAAIWSTPAADMMAFPARAFVRFFSNHGLLQLNDRPQWRTVRGGSREYVRRITTAGRFQARAGDPVVSVRRDAGGVTLITQRGATVRADRCLLACHADEALQLLADSDGEERALLGAFRYAHNTAVLHGDASFMPKRRRIWSSWNYHAPGAQAAPDAASLTYWMNKLQPLPTDRQLFVTLNPARRPSDVFRSFRYAHPMFDAEAMAAQTRLWSLQGRRHTWFAGSYFAYGFHEDALQSGLAAAEDLGGVRRPWTVPGANDRLHIPAARSRDTGAAA